MCRKVVVGMMKTGAISTLLSEGYSKSGLTLCISQSHHRHMAFNMYSWQLDNLISGC